MKFSLNIYRRGKLASKLPGALRRQHTLCSRRLEVVGARKNGHVRGRHAMGEGLLLPSACYAG